MSSPEMWKFSLRNGKHSLDYYSAVSFQSTLFLWKEQSENVAGRAVCSALSDCRKRVCEEGGNRRQNRPQIRRLKNDTNSASLG